MKNSLDKNLQSSLNLKDSGSVDQQESCAFKPKHATDGTQMQAICEPSVCCALPTDIVKDTHEQNRCFRACSGRNSLFVFLA